MKTFQSALRHIRFEVLPTEYQYPQSWLDNGWTPKPNAPSFEEWRSIHDEVEKEIGLPSDLIIEASLREGIQLKRAAEHARGNVTPQQFLSRLNRLESEGKIRFRAHQSQLDIHREFMDANGAYIR